MADTSENLITHLDEEVKTRTVELQAANQELKENKDELQLILDTTAEAIYGMDTHGICTFCNASCLRILGDERVEDLLGQNMHAQIHHSYRDGKPMLLSDCKIIAGIISGTGTHVADEVFWKADGSSFDVEYNSYPQFMDGKVIGAVTTFTDITERKEHRMKSSI